MFELLLSVQMYLVYISFEVSGQYCDGSKLLSIVSSQDRFPSQRDFTQQLVRALHCVSMFAFLLNVPL